jgi:hypothetical protein
MLDRYDGVSQWVKVNGRESSWLCFGCCFPFSNKHQDGRTMLENRNYMNQPFILFFKACSVPNSFKKGFVVNMIKREKGESKLIRLWSEVRFDQMAKKGSVCG